MPNLLSITSSPRGDHSISRSLAAKFIEEWKKAHPGGQVVTRDLYATELPFVDLPWIAGAYTPPDQHSPETQKAIKISDELIAELKAADEMLIGAPMYNFSTPAILKAWIDHIVRLNVTFTPQYEGLLKNKKATIIIASGGVYTAGSDLEGYNMEKSYLTAILGFIGIKDVSFVLAGGTSAVDRGQKKLEEVITEFTPSVLEAAAK